MGSRPARRKDIVRGGENESREVRRKGRKVKWVCRDKTVKDEEHFLTSNIVNTRQCKRYIIT